MNCDDVRSLLGPLIDDELPVEVVARVHQHTATCVSCEDERLKLAAVRSRLHQYRAELEPEAGFMERLKHGVDSRRQANSQAAAAKRVRYLPLSAAVATAAVALICLMPRLNSSNAPAVPGPISATKAPTLTAQNLYAYEKEGGQPRLAAYEKPSSQETDLANSNPPTFHGWQLVSTSAVSVKTTKGIKYAYRRLQNGKEELMSCYQFPSGAFDGSELAQHTIDGRKVCCGTSGKVSLVFWSNKEKDFVLASQMSRADLMDIALNS